ncbi:hypothetical protein F8388_019212 [Cannabis sativa]|uniref:Uncharacterized protein n=1 Tax=Cannabis sativa TaxID=3483 RepID=A0A7J6F5V1_CANSA|nr:hypothetical protein F8388_019212 [Cannabis sativa]
MKSAHFLVTLAIFALASFIASAYDPSPLQDFCVAVDDPEKALFVNGKFCKDPMQVKAEDFFLHWGGHWTLQETHTTLLDPM